MRRRITLYIDGRAADLQEQSLVLFNYAFEELGDPAIVKNSYSHQVTLPATPTNNRIFGDYYRVDRVTEEGFNALVRTPFVIIDEMSQRLESGYLRLDSVEYKSSKVQSYTVSLYGGLGGYFYALSYNDDDTKRTLGDLTYIDRNGDEFVPAEATIALDRNTVSAAWTYLQNGGGLSRCPWANIINFAPCYNGVPSDFDAKKVIVSNGQFTYIEPSSGNTYPHPQSGGAYLVTTATDKTADEVRDYRPYLQRPVLNVMRFIEALELRGGFTVSDGVRAVLDREIWITLPLPPRSDDYSSYALASFFKDAVGPSDLLVSLAKSFGFVFSTADESVRMMTRDEFFSAGVDLDFHTRIDPSSIKLSPMAFDSKWYSWKEQISGAFADAHKERYGYDYGEQRVNTGYAFNTDTKEVMKSLKTRGAAMVRDSSTMYQFAGGTKGIFPATFYESVSFQGYNQQGTDSSNNDLPHQPPYQGSITYYGDYELSDAYAKPQFCDKDDKAKDGSGVLLFFTGMHHLPIIQSGTLYDNLCWYLRDDDTELLALLNEGTPCWDMRKRGERLYYMPVFSRFNGDDSLDFGIPAELGDPGASVSADTLYASRWASYIADRYDQDALVMRCKADLSGYKVDDTMLGNFYWYGGSWWVLNKISNHSLTTYDLTDCEFVRVMDKTSYYSGQFVNTIEA